MPEAAMPNGAKKTLHENLKDSCEGKRCPWESSAIHSPGTLEGHTHMQGCYHVSKDQWMSKLFNDGWCRGSVQTGSEGIKADLQTFRALPVWPTTHIEPLGKSRVTVNSRQLRKSLLNQSLTFKLTEPPAEEWNSASYIIHIQKFTHCR